MRWSVSWLCALCTFATCSPTLASLPDEPGSRARASPKFSDNDLTGLVSPNAAHYPAGHDGEDEEDYVISPQTYVHCCPLAARRECQEACEATLRVPRAVGIGQLLDSLQREGCDILLHDPLTQCLMTRAVPRADSPVGRVGQDAAKLHCCELAGEPQCRRLCHRAFSTDWAAAGPQLHEQCLSSANETGLASCLDEVDWPCSSRCSGSGLDFCSLEGLGPWFRTCSGEADLAARMDVAQWQRDGLVRGSPRGVLPLPRTPSSSPACGPGAWRSLACLLHTRPCDPRAGSRTACRSDCIALVTQCVDWLQVTPGFSAKVICSDLTDAPGCVPLRSLLPAPAPPPAASSPPRVPAAGCSLGDVSAVTVTPGTVVRLAGNGSSPGACPQACVCGPSGRLEGCVALPCSSHQFCRVGTELLRSRQTVFRDCLVCSCSWGKLTCVQRLGRGCAPSRPGLGGRCRCAPHLMPVCGRNGRTYRNLCLATCAGLPDARPGPCSAADPCAGNPCPGGSECVPARRVCLSLQQVPCPQHQCVPVTNCSSQSQPACDTQGRQHLNACALRRAGRSLAYLGPCIPATEQGPVCGADGETYPSESAALAARVPVDSLGACQARGPCEPVRGRGCLPAGPGAGVLHAALSVKELDRALLTLGDSWFNKDSAFTLCKLLEDLQQVVLEEECRVLGYLTQDEELVVVLKPMRGDSSACGREAERLAGQFEQSGARLQAFMLLSAVVAVDVLGEGQDAMSGSERLSVRWSAALFSTIAIQVALSVHR